MKIRSPRGFTLIELLLVIGIIAILASIVIVAINPTKQMGDARDAQRRSDVNTLLNAIYQYAIDNKGVMPGCLGAATAPVGPQHICINATCTTVTDPCDLHTTLTPDYLVSIPSDPLGATGNDTNYTVEISSGRITVTAPETEQADADISVTR